MQEIDFISIPDNIKSRDEDLEKLRNEIIEYIYILIDDAEKKIYQIIINNGFDKDILIANNDKTIHDIILLLHENKFNEMYESLKDGVDEIVDIFANFQKYKNHSPWCLIKEISVSTLEIHQNIDRSNLDISSIDSYVKSIHTEFLKVANASNTAYYLNHSCSDENHSYDLFDVPLGEKQFKFTSTSEPNEENNQPL